MTRLLQRYLALHWSNLQAALGRVVRQPGATLLTIAVIAIALALPAGLRVFVSNMGALSGRWEGAADFTAYLKMDVTARQGAELAERLSEHDGIAEIAFLSRDQALSEFKQRSGFGEALDALDDNPLPHALIVRPLPGDAISIETLAAQLEALEETEFVQIDTQWVERLQGMLALAASIVDLSALLLGLAVALVIGNTIRLEINNRHTEIEVMKLVGGSDGFIRRPFLYLGFCYGLVGAIVAALIVGAVVLLLKAPVRSLAELYASEFRLSGLSLRESLILVGSGGLLGWLGAWLAAARHLRAIEPA